MATLMGAPSLDRASATGLEAADPIGKIVIGLRRDVFVEQHAVVDEILADGGFGIRPHQGERQLVHAVGGMEVCFDVVQQTTGGRMPARERRVGRDAPQFGLGLGELAGADEASRGQIRRDAVPGG